MFVLYVFYVYLTDIDECQENVCGVNAICSNQPGTFRCECLSGYVFASDDKTCIGEAKNVCVCVSVCRCGCGCTCTIRGSDINIDSFEDLCTFVQTLLPLTIICCSERCTFNTNYNLLVLILLLELYTQTSYTVRTACAMCIISTVSA